MAGFWSKLFSSEEKPSSAQTAKDKEACNQIIIPLTSFSF
jgi:hypothetical protein